DVVKLLQEIEHWSVLVIQQSMRHANDIVRRNPNEVLVERTVVNRAETQTVRDRGGPLGQRVTHDVRRVEECHLPQPADRTSVFVRRENDRPKATLMQANSHLARGVAASHLVQNRNGLTFV